MLQAHLGKGNQAEAAQAALVAALIQARACMMSAQLRSCLQMASSGEDESRGSVAECCDHRSALSPALRSARPVTGHGGGVRVGLMSDCAPPALQLAHPDTCVLGALVLT
jgi:hypothetical protein